MFNFDSIMESNQFHLSDTSENYLENDVSPLDSSYVSLSIVNSNDVAFEDVIYEEVCDSSIIVESGENENVSELDYLVENADSSGINNGEFSSNAVIYEKLTRLEEKMDTLLSILSAKETVAKNYSHTRIKTPLKFEKIRKLNELLDFEKTHT